MHKSACSVLRVSIIERVFWIKTKMHPRPNEMQQFKKVAKAN